MTGGFTVAQWLVSQGASILQADKDGLTPLYVACLHGHLEVVKWLIRQGASVTQTEAKGSTPLHAACFNGHLPVVEFLLTLDANPLLPNQVSCSRHLMRA
eukprot:m.653224 g.653224  ORF g.653224 m.653224 type:complete len:100 (+) comp58402_c0_seq22:1201-1500(+)